MDLIEKLQRIIRKKSDEEVKVEKGYNPNLVAAIQPQGGIKFEPNYIRLGDGYITCLHVYKYQSIVQDYWLEPILNMPNVIATIDIANANKHEVVEKINRAMAEQNARFYNAKENIERIDARNLYQELDQLYNDIALGEIVKCIHLRLYVKGKTLEELEINTRRVMEELEAMNFRSAVF